MTEERMPSDETGTKEEERRQAVSKLVRVNAKPVPVDIDLARTAVIVVDMQNAFVSEGGMFAEAGYDISRAPAIIAKNAELLPALREAGVKVVYLKMSYTEDYSDAGGPQSPNWHKELGLLLMKDRPENWGRYVTQGTWDEEIREEIAPCPGDTVVRKQRYSGFAGTNLDMVLKTFGIRYCLYTGVATNVCVETTLRDGYLLDYWPILVADACDNSGPEHNRLATEWNVEHAFGWVTSTRDVLKALSPDSDG
jgi:ureidoacrylate peracid hydrolase